MPTVMQIVAPSREPADLLSEHVRAILPFVAIGLALGLIAALTGVQGVWL